MIEDSNVFSSIQTKKLLIFIKIAIVVLGPIFFFWQDFQILFVDAFLNDTMNYILAVPVILVYLLYRKRKIIKSIISLDNYEFKYLNIEEILGLVLILCAFLLYWYGSQTFSPVDYHLLALPFFVSGCILTLFNINLLKELIFPIVFLMLLIPPPADILYSVGSLFSNTGSQLAYVVISTFGIPITMNINYGTPVFLLNQQNGTPLSFTVDIACSGIYSQLSFLIFALFIAYIVRGEIWKKIVVFSLGFPVMYLLNVMRISTILAIGYYFGADLALYVFHLLGGWILIFIGTLLILFFSEKILKIQIISSSNPPNKLETNQNNKKLGNIIKTFDHKLRNKQFMKIFSLVLIIAVMFSIQAPIFALTEGPSEIFAKNPQSEETIELLPEIEGYTKIFTSRDEKFEEISNQDASLKYLYVPKDDTEKTIWVTIEIASGRSSLHRWEYCLINYPLENDQNPEVEQKLLETIDLNENPPIVATYFVFSPPLFENPAQVKEDGYEVVLYWYENSVFENNSTSTQKQVKLSIITLADETEDLHALREELLVFANSINNYWQPIKTWSQISLSISKTSDMLLPISFGLLLCVGGFWVVNKKQSGKTKLKIYHKLPKIDKLILESIASIDGVPSPTNILNAYEKIAGQKIDISILNAHLEQMRGIGLIQQKIYNVNDYPFLGWQLLFPSEKKVLS